MTAWKEQRLALLVERHRLMVARRALPATMELFCRAGGWWGTHRAHLHGTWLKDGAVAHAERIVGTVRRRWVAHDERGLADVAEVLESVQAVVLEQVLAGVPVQEALPRALADSDARWQRLDEEELADVAEGERDDAVFDAWRDAHHL